MSVSIYCGSTEYTNLSSEVHVSDPEFVFKTEEGFDWFEDTYPDTDFDELTCDEKIKVLQEFKEQYERILEIEENFCLANSNIFVLQVNAVSSDRIKLIEEYCSGVVVVYVESLQVYGLGLSASGTCHKDSLELAKLLLDGESDIRSEEFLTLPRRSRDLLDSLRNVSPINCKTLTTERAESIIGELKNSFKILVAKDIITKKPVMLDLLWKSHTLEYVNFLTSLQSLEDMDLDFKDEYVLKEGKQYTLEVTVVLGIKLKYIGKIFMEQ